ncbi:hypothetical protein [Deinococcus sonorensis]|uniref:Uncharacterized protein n=2 Tax=Deinococcus sonorensis TaxID=309891 RepID=A0AAU7UA27_9DEIO
MTLLRLFARQVTARVLPLALTAALMVGAAALLARQAPQAQLLTWGLLLIGLVPLLTWLLGGLSAFGRGVGGRLPTSGHRWAWSAYLRLLLEILLLSGVWVAILLTFGVGVLPLGNLGTSGSGGQALGLMLLAALVGPPATSIAGGAIGRSSRLGFSGGVLAFLLLSGVWWVLSSRLPGGVALSVPLQGFPAEYCPARCVLRANGAALALQPCWALVMLWLAGHSLSRATRPPLRSLPVDFPAGVQDTGPQHRT